MRKNEIFTSLLFFTLRKFCLEHFTFDRADIDCGEFDRQFHPFYLLG